MPRPPVRDIWPLSDKRLQQRDGDFDQRIQRVLDQIEAHGPHGGGGGSWATVTVAAYDSHEKAKDEADFVCTGVNDEVTLALAREEMKDRCTLPGGTVTTGKLGLYQGTFLLKAPFTNSNGFTLTPMRIQGMGIGTVIKADVGFPGGTSLIQLLCLFSGSSFWAEISDLRIDGANLAEACLQFAGEFQPNPSGHRFLAHDLYVGQPTLYGIRTSAGTAPASRIERCEVFGAAASNAIGIYADGVNPNYVANCYIRMGNGSNSVGILGRGRFINNIVENADFGISPNHSGTGNPEANQDPDQVISNYIIGGDVGIRADCNSGVIADNIIVNTGEHCIYVGGTRNVISNNRLRDSGSDGTFPGIQVDGDENLIIGNKIRNMTGHGIRLTSFATDNRVWWNDVRNNTGGTYSNVNASNSIIDDITVAPGGDNGPHIIQEEGVPVAQRSNLNFTGAGVVVTDDAVNDQTDVTIAGGGGTHDDVLHYARINA